MRRLRRSGFARPRPCNNAVTERWEVAGANRCTEVRRRRPMPDNDERHHGRDTSKSLERNRRRDRPADRGRCRGYAVSAGARYRPGRGDRGAARKVDPGGRDRRRLRARRLRHVDLLRFLRPAHDRSGCGALSDRGAGKLHQLFHRPQSRRDCLHRRGNQISDLFRLGLGHHRCRQDRLRHGTDVLARQCVPARVRHVVRACGRERRQSIAPMDQPR